jgi:hypothetical protein
MAFSATVTEPGALSARFTPPGTPLVLTRTVWRSLHDGKEIVSKRRYAVRISPHGSGYEVEGELIDSSVEAPPQLAMLAELERARPDGALFPTYLDANGRIEGNPSASDPAIRQEGMDEARRLVGGSTMAGPAKVQAGSLMDQIMHIGGAAPWPADLFHPIRPEQREQHRLTLSDGSEGGISVALVAHGQLQGGLPRSVERTVVTELEGTRKVSREEWTIEAGTDTHI